MSRNRSPDHNLEWLLYKYLEALASSHVARRFQVRTLAASQSHTKNEFPGAWLLLHCWHNAFPPKKLSFFAWVFSMMAIVRSSKSRQASLYRRGRLLRLGSKRSRLLCCWFQIVPWWRLQAVFVLNGVEISTHETFCCWDIPEMLPCRGNRNDFDWMKAHEGELKTKLPKGRLQERSLKRNLTECLLGSWNAGIFLGYAWDGGVDLGWAGRVVEGNQVDISNWLHVGIVGEASHSRL